MIDMDLISPLLAAVGYSLVHFVWEGALVGIVMYGVLLGLKENSPRLRYGVACIGLIFLALLPVMNWFLLPLPTFSPEEFVAQRGLPVAPVVPGGVSTPVPITDEAPASLTYSGRGGAADSELALDRPVPVPEGYWYASLPWIAALWTIGVLLIGMRDLAGIATLKQMRKHALPVEEEMQRRADQLAESIGLFRRVPVFWTESLKVPAAIGWVSPAIMLPASMLTGCPPETLRAILSHELAHIRRHDTWVNLVQLSIETLLFFHPVVWWLSARIRVEREFCCDDIVVDQGVDRTEYARVLLGMAETAFYGNRLALSGQGGELHQRICRILRLSEEAALRPISGISVVVLVMIPVLLGLLSVTVHAFEGEDTVTLNFPDDRSVGAVSVRWKNQDYRQEPWIPDHDLGWTVLADAQGEVQIPGNCLVRLQTNEKDLSFLYDLPPNSLYMLSCKGGGLLDEGMIPIASMTGLRALDFGRNLDVTDAGIDVLSPLTQLEWFSLERTGVTGKNTDVFRALESLQFLDFYDSAFSDEGLRQLGSAKKLEWLGVELARGVTEEGVRFIHEIQSLRGLNLENCGLSNGLFRHLGDMPELQYLALKRNEISDEGLRDLGAMPKLISLNLSATNVSDTWLCELSDLTRLKVLNLENTKVTAVCRESLLDIPNLSSVVLTLTDLSISDQRSINAALMDRWGEQAPSQASSNPDAPRVGITISHYGATGPSWISRNYGYKQQRVDDVFQMLDEANYDVYAVIEPQTELLGELPALLRSLRLQDKLVDVSDPQALGQLDAVFAFSPVNLHPNVLASLKEAISKGMGLVTVRDFATVTPGYDDDGVAAITGIRNGRHAWKGRTGRHCFVIGEHPILGDVPVGTRIEISHAEGGWTTDGAIEGGQSLIGAPNEFPETYSTMYVRNLGAGRIVRFQWAELNNPDVPFGQFGIYLRSINWAAKRDVATVW